MVWRMRSTVFWRGVRIQRWRWLIRKSTPCSLWEMGYSVVTTSTGSTPVPVSSKPPGARSSARTMPVNRNEDSWVRLEAASQMASSTSFFTTTACTTPVPSRMIRNWILPLERLLYSQPWRVTSWPTKSFRWAIVVTGRVLVVAIGRGPF
ncbi:hypothetical protein D3C72_869980 [compost metagenome]